MHVIRTGIIGTGFFGTLRARAFHENPRAGVVCVSSRRAEIAAEKAKEFGCDFTTDYHELLRREDVDAVVVCVPNPLHYQVALDVLRAGKHAVVEYPIAQTVEEFNSLADEAKKRNLVLHHALTPLIEPQPLAMKRLINKIGKIMTMRSSYVAGEKGSWYLDPQLRGNFYSAFTIHMVAYQNAVLSESPEWVFGARHFQGTDRNSCHSGAFLCRYPSGIFAYNEWGMGFVRDLPQWQWTIEGEEGSLVYDYDVKEHHIRVITEKENTTVELEPQAAAIPTDADNFLDQVILGADSYVSDRCSREILAACEAAQLSAETGQKISVNYSH
jgi:biliverdin reductase